MARSKRTYPRKKGSLIKKKFRSKSKSKKSKKKYTRKFKKYLGGMDPPRRPPYLHLGRPRAAGPVMRYRAPPNRRLAPQVNLGNDAQRVPRPPWPAGNAAAGNQRPQNDMEPDDLYPPQIGDIAFDLNREVDRLDARRVAAAAVVALERRNAEIAAAQEELRQRQMELEQAEAHRMRAQQLLNQVQQLPEYVPPPTALPPAPPPALAAPPQAPDVISISSDDMEVGPTMTDMEMADARMEAARVAGNIMNVDSD